MEVIMFNSLWSCLKCCANVYATINQSEYKVIVIHYHKGLFFLLIVQVKQVSHFGRPANPGFLILDLPKLKFKSSMKDVTYITYMPRNL